MWRTCKNVNERAETVNEFVLDAATLRLINITTDWQENIGYERLHGFQQTLPWLISHGIKQRKRHFLQDQRNHVIAILFDLVKECIWWSYFVIMDFLLRSCIVYFML